MSHHDEVMPYDWERCAPLPSVNQVPEVKHQPYRPGSPGSTLALDALDVLKIHIERLEADRERIAKLLATFYESQISISALQPLLDLARELNPRLR